MKVRFWNKLESFVRREEQLWPDGGRPSNTFLPLHAVRGGKATQTYSFQGLSLNSSQLLTFPKTSSMTASLIHNAGSQKKATLYRQECRDAQAEKAHRGPAQTRGVHGARGGG